MDNKLAIRRHLDVMVSAMTGRGFSVPEVKLTHRFTPGLYSREIVLPAGSWNISKIHKTEHQYIISNGHVEVYDAATNTVTHIRGPHHGITQPGTQRAVFAHEDTIWTTFHPTTLTTPEEIEDEIIQKPDENSITISEEKMKQLMQRRLQ